MTDALGSLIVKNKSLLSILLALIWVNSILLKKSVIFSDTSKEHPVPVVISCAKLSAISKNSFAGIETT